MTRLLVTDLDATIVFDRSVSPADREAMARWRAAGNLLAVDTGKSSFATRDVLAPLGVDFDYGVVFTGAVLIDGGYQVLSARYLPDGVARDVATRTVDLPGVTTYATTIETDYILADNNEEISSILAVFEHLSLEEMDAHRFIGVPLRVPGAGRASWTATATRSSSTSCPPAPPRARACAPSWTGPWQDRTSRSGPSATPGTTWTCTPSPTTPSPCPGPRRR